MLMLKCSNLNYVIEGCCNYITFKEELLNYTAFKGFTNCSIIK